MKNQIESIMPNPLFNGIEESDFEKMLRCIEAKPQSFIKEEIVLPAGKPVNSVGLIVSGKVRIIIEDINGNISILTELGEAELFGEVFACAGTEHSPVTVQASKNCEILFLNYKKITATCSSACVFHTKLIENMLRLLAKKNLMLNQKIEILSKRSTREKLIGFFDSQRGTAKKFSIPFNREELAHYLCVDRSAMSNELCKMRDEGLIKFNKNMFEIL